MVREIQLHRLISSDSRSAMQEAALIIAALFVIWFFFLRRNAPAG